MSYVLYHKSGALTARNLARIFGITRSQSPLTIPPVIRWGCSSYQYPVDTEFNDPGHILITGNKLRCSNYLDNNNVPTLTFHRGEPERYPVVIRTLLSASGGKGIVVARNKDEWEPYKSSFYSYYFPMEAEYRFHILGGELVKAFRKVADEDNRESDEYPIRNLHNGYSFKRVDFNNKIKFDAIDFAKKLYKAFPIMMMGADVGYNSKEGVTVIEINSAPSLNNPTLALYAKFINSNLNIVSDLDGNLQSFYERFTDFGGFNENNRTGDDTE